MDYLRKLDLRVTDRSHDNEYNLSGNATFIQHYGPVYNQTTIHTPVQYKLPPLPRCPAPSSNYTKRRHVENHMRSYFLVRSGRKCYVLHGSGGIGKTEIGLDLVDEFYYSQEPGNERFAEVYWIDATTDKTIDESFKAIALSTGAGSEAKDALLLLENCKGPNANWMIFFNNADDPGLDLAKYFPKCSHGNILITTRNYYARRYAVGPGSDYALSEMTADEALTLFQKHARVSIDTDPSSIGEAKALVKELGYSALSVSRAGAFVSASPYTPGQYLTLYRERRRSLLCEHEKMQTTNGYPYHSIHAALMISYERLSDPAKDVIQVLACIYHEGIHEEMFSKSFSGGLDALNSKSGALFTESEKAGLAKLKEICESLSTNGKWDVIKFRQMISKLRSYSLVKFDAKKGTCSMHPVVHECVGSLGDAEGRTVLRQSAVLLLGSSLVRFETAEDLAFCRAFAPHVDRVFQGFDAKTSVCGGRFGKVYQEAGRWNDAALHQESYQELCKQKLGEEHQETLTAIADVATTCERQGRYKEAEELQQQVLNIRKRVLGAQHPDTLIAMSDLALTYWRQDRPDEAEELVLRVIEARKRVLGADHPDTLIAMNILALAYSHQGRHKDSEKLHLRIMELRDRVLGAIHPDTLTSMNNLASTYFHQRRFEEAEKLGLHVLEARKRVLGAEHPDTLNSMGNLALTYSNQRRFQKATKLQIQVVETQKKVLGAGHPHTLASMDNLANTYSKQQQFDEAEKLHSQVLQDRRRVLGAEHPDTLASVRHLASTHSEQQRFEQSVRNLAFARGAPVEADVLMPQTLTTHQHTLGAKLLSMLFSLWNNTLSKIKALCENDH